MKKFLKIEIFQDFVLKPKVWRFKFEVYDSFTKVNSIKSDGFKTKKEILNEINVLIKVYSCRDFDIIKNF
jgi:hypothetical protein